MRKMTITLEIPVRPMTQKELEEARAFDLLPGNLHPTGTDEDIADEDALYIAHGIAEALDDDYVQMEIFAGSNIYAVIEQPLIIEAKWI